MLNLFVLSRLLAEEIKFYNDRTLVISIRSPGTSPPKLKGNHIYFFEFYDIDRELFLEKENKIIRPMEKEIAEQIVNVVLDNRDKKNLVIHCETGISRSPGVALGLAKFIAFSDKLHILETRFPCHNKYVRRLIEEAMEIRIREIETALLMDRRK